MNAYLLCLVVVLAPLAGFVVNGVGFRHVPRGLAGGLACAALLVSFGGSLVLFNGFVAGGSQPIAVPLFRWFAVAGTDVSFAFLVDQLSLTMLLIITGVGALIHVYSVGYMHHDEGFGKFMAFLNLFVFFMLVLVLGSNYLVTFIGWEGVGLCSYLLIGFWNTNTSYGAAARKAFVMNRIGDLGYLLGIFLILQTFGTVEYTDVFGKAAAGSFGVNNSTLVAITLLLFVGAMGKSAQIPLYTWLPDAMAGPTPVSALIHAATMVTAGIYMVVRSNVLYTLAPATLEVVGIVGLATALLGATIGIFQNDIKKVLAYSTVSQLGYMFLGLGVGAYSSSLFHVITHAFFKALLFLAAGSVIHALGDEQDIRRMGGLRRKLPITFATFVIGTVAIAGIPPLSGFFSKDEILLHVWEHSKLMWALGVLGSLMTSFYMFRVLFLTFAGDFRGTAEQAAHLHESPVTMTGPLVVLAGLSAVGGLVGLPEVLGHHRLGAFLEPLFAQARQVRPDAFAAPADHATEWLLMGISTAVALVALLAAYATYVSRRTLPVADDQPRPAWQQLVYRKYYVDELYNALFVKPINALSSLFYSVVDVLLIDVLVNGVGKLTTGAGKLLRNAQNGTIGFYVFAMVVSILVILVMNFFVV